MSTLKSRQNKFSDEYGKDMSLKLLFPKNDTTTREEVVYRKNGKSIDKVVEFDTKTGSKIRTTHYDYFNDKKIRSVDEFDGETGKKIRTINFVLYKSIDEYDLETGKKIRTINYNVKDESKISSIQEYDLETGKIITVSIFKRDGKTVSITKKIDPVTDKVTNYVHKDTHKNPLESSSFLTRSYDKIKCLDQPNESIGHLIDNLYNNNIKFENVTK